MSFLDMFRVGKYKSELEQTQKERDALKSRIVESEELMKHHQLKRAFSLMEERNANLAQQIASLDTDFQQKTKALNLQLENHKIEIVRKTRCMDSDFANRQAKLEQQIQDMDSQLSSKKAELIVLDDEILLQSFGFYKPRYEFENSEIYRAKLGQIRKQQETMVKERRAAYCTTSFTVNDSKKEGERLVKDYVKLLLRSFNNECDASIINVKFTNVNSIETKLKKAFEVLNNLGQRMNIVISPEYLNLKLSELYLCHEYQIKKQEEKEEQRRIREEMREDAKLQKEIEELKAKIEKEERHFNQALQKLNTQLKTATTDNERDLLQNEINSIKNNLAKVEKDKEDVLYREQSTRAGYVYIISNIGSFGENVYKIGVTRRLEPQDRVDELGDASVPFYFDVHAMIFSDDAPALENALHKAFNNRRLNRINLRREFFHVTLSEIEDVVRRNFNKPVEFTKLAEAEQYRQSMQMQLSLKAG
jgi:hypothetical protein